MKFIKTAFLQKNCEKLEISLNLKDFTGFLQIEMFTKLLFFQSFSSRNILSPTLLLKLYPVWAGKLSWTFTICSLRSTALTRRH